MVTIKSSEMLYQSVYYIFRDYHIMLTFLSCFVIIASVHFFSTAKRNEPKKVPPKIIAPRSMPPHGRRILVGLASLSHCL